jgi:replicative DNA helicase
MAVSPEALLISSVVKNGDFVLALKSGLTSDMFHGYREEFMWLENYYQKHRKTPSRIAFRSAFNEFRIRDVDDTAHFSEEVRKSHAMHTMTQSMNEATEFLMGGDIDTAIKKMSASMVSIAAGMGNLNDGDILRSHRDIMDDINLRKNRFDENGSAGIPTGFETLDERTGGPQPGELWIFGARLGEGKSWILQRMAANACMYGFNVQFDALEQSRSQVAMRIYSMLSGQMGKGLFDSRALMQGKDYDPRAFRRFVTGLKDNIEGRLHVSDASRGKVSTLTIASQIERNKPDIVYVDYITLLKKNSSEWQGVAELSSDLTQLAVEYNIPIVAASQLNRESGISRKGEPPGAEALSQADAIGQDASVVVNMARWAPSVLKLKAVKSRNTESNFSWYVQHDPGIGKFGEVTQVEAEKIKERDLDKRDAEAVKNK